jgi:imidazolonepropionase-like amidohydrolase
MTTPEESTLVAFVDVNIVSMPGLVDMHAHFLRQPDGTNTEPEFARLPGYQQRNGDSAAALFVANGITSIRQLHSHTAGDELAKRTSDREWIGPKIYSTLRRLGTIRDPRQEMFVKALETVT